MKVCILRRQCLISTVPENPHFPVVMSAFERFDALKMSSCEFVFVFLSRQTSLVFISHLYLFFDIVFFDYFFYIF